MKLRKKASGVGSETRKRVLRWDFARLLEAPEIADRMRSRPRHSRAGRSAPIRRRRPRAAGGAGARRRYRRPTAPAPSRGRDGRSRSSPASGSSRCARRSRRREYARCAAQGSIPPCRRRRRSRPAARCRPDGSCAAFAPSMRGGLAPLALRPSDAGGQLLYDIADWAGGRHALGYYLGTRASGGRERHLAACLRPGPPI